MLPGVGRAAELSANSSATPFEQDMARCKELGDDAERLTCYDKAVGRQHMLQVPASPMAAAAAASVPASAPAPTAPHGGVAVAPPAAAASAVASTGDDDDSLMSRYWELREGDKRGTFNYTAYRPNLFQPLHLVSHVNQHPSSPTRGTANNLPGYQHGEAKFELSLRSKVAQDLLLPQADLWVGYTQVSMWQLWNHSASAPFRNTDYQPELIYVVPTPQRWSFLPGGWRWRMWQLGVVHQSNGQADPLSRSWNRGYVAAGLEKGELQATVRYEQRLHESPSNDDNPDIVKYLGHFDAQLAWTPGLSEASVHWRPSLRGRGSVQLNWTYPVDRAKPDGLRWYLQLFDGYGETLTDYNFRLTSLSLGLTIFKF
jgi:phospholipase A1